MLDTEAAGPFDADTSAVRATRIGVRPDVEVPAAEALNEALRLAAERRGGARPTPR